MGQRRKERSLETVGSRKVDRLHQPMRVRRHTPFNVPPVKKSCSFLTFMKMVVETVDEMR